jgi:hypothetical protein
MVKFNDRRRQAAVDAKHAAAQAKRDTVPEGYQEIPESDWDAHHGQRVFAQGHGHKTLDVDDSAAFRRYFAGGQISKGHTKLYKKPPKPQGGEPGLTSL